MFLADKTRHLAIDDCFSRILTTNFACSFLFYGIIYAKAELERERGREMKRGMESWQPTRGIKMLPKSRGP